MTRALAWAAFWIAAVGFTAVGWAAPEKVVIHSPRLGVLNLLGKELAPQTPEAGHANTPGTIFAAEAGQVTFK